MDKPLVSVVIPAYNPGVLISETIASVLEQLYHPIEIIVVDDGSTDGTRELLAPLVEGGKIVYIYQENAGQAAARKRGFEEATGTYICFIDADDLIAPEKIGFQVEYMENHQECGVHYTAIAHFWHHEPDVLLHKKLEYFAGDVFEPLLEGNFIQVMTALIRRDVLVQYGVPGAKYRRSDDWILWLNLAKHGVKFCYAPRIFSFQRRQLQGTLSDQKTYFKETAEINIAIYNDLLAEQILSEKKQARVRELINFWQFRLAVGYAILGDAASARRELAAFTTSTWRDVFKKYFFSTLLFVFPSGFLAHEIYAAREFMKRQSFERLQDAKVKLPRPKAVL